MKRITLIIMCLLTTWMVNGQNQAEIQLAMAIHEEEVNGDLQKALTLYDGIVKSFPDDRTIVAEALYRIGLSNEKLGNKQASKYYQNVINNYSDQTKLAQMAKRRLSVILATSNTMSKEPTLSVQKIYSTNTFYGNVSKDGRYAIITDWADANLYSVDMVNNIRKPLTKEGTWIMPIKYADYGIWSNDGKKIAYALYEERGDSGIYKLIVKDLISNKSETIIEMVNSFMYPVEWTNDGSQILTKGGDRNKLSIGILDLKSKTHKIYTSYEGEDDLFKDLPSISPDSKYILYSKNQDIHLISLDDGSETVVSDHSSREWGVKWCQDSKSFLYASDRSGHPAIYKIVLENKRPAGSPVLVHEGVSDSYRPLTITDGGQLIYMNSHSFADIYLSDINLKEGTITNPTLLYEEANHMRAPVWSNKGDKIAIVTKATDRPGDQILIRDMVAGKENIMDLELRVSTSAALPYWSGDDQRILMEYQNQGFHLMALDINDGTVENVKNIGRPGVFGPNNSILAGKHYTPELVMMDLDTRLIDTIYTGVESSCQGLQVSPNQKHLSFYNFGWDDEKSLVVINLETRDTEVLWEIGKTHSFKHSQSWWLPDNETLVVTLIDLDQDSNPVKMQGYTINIRTKEKRVATPAFTNPEEINFTFDLNPKGDKIVYKKAVRTDNVWALKY